MTQEAALRLEAIAAEIRHCRDCPLGFRRANAVPGAGPAHARVMLIAEGPGEQENLQGLPFVGPAGDFLDDLLALAGLNRDEVFITNMLKCQAPGNRDPQPAELAACRRHLEAQLEAVNPELVVTLGRFSAGRFLPGESISSARGRLRRREGRYIYPIMHPAAGLRRNEFRDRIVADFRELPELLRKARENPPPEEPIPETTQAPAPENRQASLF